MVLFLDKSSLLFDQIFNIILHV